MNVEVGQQLEAFVGDLVASGRYASAGDVVAEALHLMEEREAKLAALRVYLQAAVDDSRRYTTDEVRANLRDRAARWERERATG